MRAIQMTLNEDLVEEIDKIARRLKTTRSEFTRRALKNAIIDFKERELERRHKTGYMNKPVQKREFIRWEKEQAWGKE